MKISELIESNVGKTLKYTRRFLCNHERQLGLDSWPIEELRGVITEKSVRRHELGWNVSCVGMGWIMCYSTKEDPENTNTIIVTTVSGSIFQDTFEFEEPS